jgi:dolichol kinase
MANELYRQGIHLVAGILAALLAFFLPKAVFLWCMGLLLAGTLVVILFFTREVSWLYKTLEREHAAFLGKGALFFILGIFLTGLLFWEHAGVAILMLSIPDAAATIIGSMFPSPKLPYNHRKTLLGSGAFFLSGVLVLAVAQPGLSIFFIAFLLTALESFDYREIPFLDDNIVIPVITGYLLTLL